MHDWYLPYILYDAVRATVQLVIGNAMEHLKPWIARKLGGDKGGGGAGKRQQVCILRSVSR